MLVHKVHFRPADRTKTGRFLGSIRFPWKITRLHRPDIAADEPSGSSGAPPSPPLPHQALYCRNRGSISGHRCLPSRGRGLDTEPKPSYQGSRAVNSLLWSHQIPAPHPIFMSASWHQNPGPKGDAHLVPRRPGLHQCVVRVHSLRMTVSIEVSTSRGPFTHHEEVNSFADMLTAGALISEETVGGRRLKFPSSMARSELR